MPRLTRAEFLDRFAGKRLDLARVAKAPEVKRAFADAGVKLDVVTQNDLYGHDEFIAGDRELDALFQELRKLNPAGKDAMEIGSAGAATKAGNLMQVLEAVSEKDAPAPAPLAPTDRRLETLRLGGSVGAGGDNRPEDVLAVQQRLSKLGLPVDDGGALGPKTKRSILLFAGMVLGAEELDQLKVVIRPGDKVHQALAHPDAPQWVKLPASGSGFVNADTDHHDYGSSHLVRVVADVGRSYQADYLLWHPGAAPISTNDASLRAGGVTKDHESHQNGLDLDLRLPRKDGTAGTQVSNPNYDRETAWAQIRAFGQHPQVERILFHDDQLLKRAKAEPWGYKVLDGGPVHKNHFHVDVAPPDLKPAPR